MTESAAPQFIDSKETTPADSRSQSRRISVVVLTRDRIALLERCLSSIRTQSIAPLETIVVDNGSSDTTAEIVRRDYPEVRLIENGKNLGITGRNIGYRASHGEVILSLDDDIELVDAKTLSKIERAFEGRPELGALSLKIIEEETGSDFVPHHWWHPRDRTRYQDQTFETDRINEAAVAFNAEALQKVGYYYEALFWGGEESDLVLGLADANYQLWYHPTPVLHLAPRGNLNTKADYRHALLVRNRFWIAFRRLDLFSALAFILPRFALWLFRAIRHGYLGHFLGGIFDLVRRTPEIMRDRKPISADTRRRLRKIRNRN